MKMLAVLSATLLSLLGTVAFVASPASAETTRTGMLENNQTKFCLDGSQFVNQAAVMLPCQPGNGYELWELPADNQSGYIQAAQGGLCLTRHAGTNQQEVYMSRCGGNTAGQIWKMAALGKTGKFSYGHIGPAGGPVRLDGDQQYAYTHVPNTGNYQNWVFAYSK